MDGVGEVHVARLQPVTVVRVEVDVAGQPSVPPDAEAALAAAGGRVLRQQVEVRPGALDGAVVTGEPADGLAVLAGAVRLGVLLPQRSQLNGYALTQGRRWLARLAVPPSHCRPRCPKSLLSTAAVPLPSPGLCRYRPPPPELTAVPLEEPGQPGGPPLSVALPSPPPCPPGHSSSSLDIEGSPCRRGLVPGREPSALAEALDGNHGGDGGARLGSEGPVGLGIVIDPKLLRTDPDRLRRSQEARGESVDLVDDLIAADERRRQQIAASEAMRAEQKELSRQVPRASADEKPALLARTKELAQQVKDAVAEAEAAKVTFDDLMLRLPNLVIDGVPTGGEDDLYVLETIGAPRDFAAEGFEPKDHIEIAEGLRAIDMDRGSKVSGSRFYFLTGIGAQLEFALLNLAMAKAAEWGFTPMIPPALVRPSAMEGTGFLGQAAEDVYYLERDDLYLVGTSEVALAAYHSDEILDVGSLPRQYVAFSPCYRREAGSYGKDTKGIFRVHWFDKVEMFIYCDPADAEEWHGKLLNFEKEFIKLLEIPFQVLDVASGDLGLSAARKYDCYGYVPSQGRYREITSTSNCTEFQARRLNIRMRDSDGVRSVATLNGTLCSMARPIIMLLENHQQADGSVYVPEALRPYLGGREFLTPGR